MRALSRYPALSVALSVGLFADAVWAQPTPGESATEPPAPPRAPSDAPPNPDASPGKDGASTDPPGSDLRDPGAPEPSPDTASPAPAAPDIAPAAPDIAPAASPSPPHSAAPLDDRELTLQDRIGNVPPFEEHPSEITIAYSTAIALGATRDFASNFSFAGFELDWHRRMNEYFSLGFELGWQVLYEKTYGTLVDDQLTITGTQLRHLNVVPVLASTRFFPFGRSAALFPYVGAGVGAAPSEWRADVGFVTSSSFSVHLALAPEIGVQIPTGVAGRLTLGVRYNFAFASAGNPEISYFAFTVGLAR